MTSFSHYLLLPHLHVQNANAISSQLTHGFPSITAFLGFVWALDRKCALLGLKVAFRNIGVVCHMHKEWISGRYFHRMKQPAEKAKETPSIQEEGRMSMDLSLLIGIKVPKNEENMDKAEASLLAHKIYEVVSSMRLAGGIIIPRPWDNLSKKKLQPILLNKRSFEEQWNKSSKEGLAFRYQLMPGFILREREDVLKLRLTTLQKYFSNANLVDALISLCGVSFPYTSGDKEGIKEDIFLEDSQGWFVPIPVGYGVLGTHPPVAGLGGARDETTPLSSVEAEYSLGEWKSVHAISSPLEILWQVANDESKRVYRCCNVN